MDILEQAKEKFFTWGFLDNLCYLDMSRQQEKRGPSEFRIGQTG
jgi:hypothetical protein